MKKSIEHNLGLEKAQEVTQIAMASYCNRFEKYDPVMTQLSDTVSQVSFTVKGFSLTGTISVQTHCVEFEMDVPFLLSPFKQQAMAVIEEEIALWIGKVERGEL